MFRELHCNAGQELHLSPENSPHCMKACFRVVESFEYVGTWRRVMEFAKLTEADHPITRFNAFIDTLLLSGHIVPVALH